MQRDVYRDLHILNELASDRPVTQRTLAKRLNIALGLTNLLIRRLVKKGYVKIVDLGRNRVRYLLTPQGVTEQARLTYEYLEYSLYFYRQIRTFLTRAFTGLDTSDGKRMILYGTGEVAEIAFLVMQQHGLNVTGIIDNQRNGTGRFLNRPVKMLSDLPVLSYDHIVVAALKDRREIVQQLSQRGVPREKIIAIPDERTPEFRAARNETVPLPTPMETMR